MTPAVVALDERYRPLYVATALEPGEYRDLPDGRRFHIRCIDCGDLLTGESAVGDRFVPAHPCLKPAGV